MRWLVPITIHEDRMVTVDAETRKAARAKARRAEWTDSGDSENYRVSVRKEPVVADE